MEHPLEKIEVLSSNWEVWGGYTGGFTLEFVKWRVFVKYWVGYCPEMDWPRLGGPYWVMEHQHRL